MITDNLITIKGGAYNDIKKALQQWIDMYSSKLHDGLIFELYRKGKGNHIIKVDEKLDNELFYYLVNYLVYPENIEYKIEIRGFTTGKDENILKNKKLLVYISTTDKDGDNVFVTTNENRNYKIDFGGKITETNESIIFMQPDTLSFENPEFLKVNKKEYLEKAKKISKDNINKRFKILSLFGLGLLMISFCFYFIDILLFQKFTLFIGMALALWFFIDYKMLQSNKHYIYCLLISIGFCGYTLFLIQTIKCFDIINVGTLNSLTLLIIQKPTRVIYKLLFKREPRIDTYIGTFWDFIYMLILLFGFVLLPLLVYIN